MASLAFAFPLTPGKAKEWRYWGKKILGARRSEYEACSTEELEHEHGD
jgi:hypothetical protein